MTDEQIVRALEVISTTANCNECAFYCGKVCNCSQVTAIQALDLIKRQQEEIEKLNKVKVFNFTVSGTKEIIPVLFSHEKEMKNESVKKFAERLTDIICEKIEKSMSNPNGDNYFITDVYTDIDNLVKEMTEKEGGKG